MDPLAILEKVISIALWMRDNYKDMNRAKKASAEIALRCEHLTYIAERVRGHMSKLSESDRKLLAIPLKFLESHLEDTKNLMTEIKQMSKALWFVRGSSKKLKLEDCLTDLRNDETSLTTAQGTLTNELLIAKTEVEKKATVVVPKEEVPDDDDKGRQKSPADVAVEKGKSLLSETLVDLQSKCLISISIQYRRSSRSSNPRLAMPTS